MHDTGCKCSAFGVGVGVITTNGSTQLGSSVRQPFQRVKANGDPAVHFAVERKVVLTKSHTGHILDIPQTKLVKM